MWNINLLSLNNVKLLQLLAVHRRSVSSLYDKWYFGESTSITFEYPDIYNSLVAIQRIDDSECITRFFLRIKSRLKLWIRCRIRTCSVSVMALKVMLWLQSEAFLVMSWNRRQSEANESTFGLKKNERTSGLPIVQQVNGTRKTLRWKLITSQGEMRRR